MTGTQGFSLVIDSIEQVADFTYLIHMNKNTNFHFMPGQYISAGIEGIMREYSITSGVDSEFLSILYKEIKDGQLTPKLSTLKPGALIQIQGPFGYFTIPDPYSKHLLIATGTGIAPFLSYIESYPKLDYTLIHGISTIDESPYKGEILRCTSKDTTGDFPGRVTDYLRQMNDLEAFTYFSLCGNGEMVYEVFDLLQKRGISASNILTEVYF
jgi:ferredoxin--NADP+ reductase